MSLGRQRLSCPACGDKTSEAREAVVYGEVMYRRRKCLAPACGVTYSTGEIVLPAGVKPVYRGTMRDRAKRDLEGAHRLISEALTRAGDPKPVKVPRRPPRQSTQQRIFEFIKENPNCRRAEIDAAIPERSFRTVTEHLFKMKAMGWITGTRGRQASYKVAERFAGKDLDQAWRKAA